ncbi:MAG: hypothetical protein NT075_13530 [Chloroflexi bacterium]|nr:hypothetical protein [Chloroflexota bacterium]
MSTPKKIAAIITEYRRHSHADVIVSKFLRGLPTDDGLVTARIEIVSMYVDQFPDADMARGISAEFNVPIYPSIVKALTLGGAELAVDGVLLIGEHGDYPWNEREQQLFPRKYFMEQICGVFASSKRAVPIFSDKHLSYNWHDAKWMYDRARQLNVPFMAGSSLPLGWRAPWIEHELDTPIQEAVAIGYDGLDVYGFHALETLQCMVERRVGGETGVAAVTCLEGDAVWQAAQVGLWSRPLAEAACEKIRNKPATELEALFPKPAVFIIEYRDGFRAAVLMCMGNEDTVLKTFAYAARVNGQVQAAEVFLGDNPYPHFSYLSLNVEEMFLSGQPTWPVERTLLTTGILEAVLESRYRGHVRIATPYLAVNYRSFESIPWRSKNPRPIDVATVPMH